MVKHYTHESEIEATLKNDDTGEYEYLETMDRNDREYETEW